MGKGWTTPNVVVWMNHTDELEQAGVGGPVCWIDQESTDQYAGEGEAQWRREEWEG